MGDTIGNWTSGPRTAGGADAKKPSDDRYYITVFGDADSGDQQSVACSLRGMDVPRTSRGTPYADGTWWYIADKDRFGCGTRVRITDPDTGRSCVAVVADIGPATFVEQRANGPVIDASPLITQHLFGRRRIGATGSERKVVIAEPVSADTPLGPSGVVSTTGRDLTIAALVGMAAGAAWWLHRNARHVKTPVKRQRRR